MSTISQESFNATIDSLYKSTSNNDVWIQTDKNQNLLTSKKSNRFVRILSLLLRIIGIDVYCHVRVNNVADAILKNVKDNDTLMNENDALKLYQVLVWLDKRTKGIHHQSVQKVVDHIRPQLPTNPHSPGELPPTLPNRPSAHTMNKIPQPPQHSKENDTSSAEKSSSSAGKKSPRGFNPLPLQQGEKDKDKLQQFLERQRLKAEAPRTDGQSPDAPTLPPRK